MQNNNTETEIYKLIAEWLEEYHSAVDKYKKSRIKALIVTRMLPIIKRIARTIARRSYDPIEDMVQAGSIGLLKAIDSYSPDLSDNFKIYAGYLIIGEMKHYIRDKMNTIRVPRHIQELTYRINTFTASLTAEQLNELTDENVAEALHVPPKAVDIARITERRKDIVSLEDIFNADSDSLSYEEVLSKENYKDLSDFEDAKIVVKDLVKVLPEDDRELLELFYYKDMSKKEIAEFKNLSQMQINRRFKKIFTLLSEKVLGTEAPSDTEEE